jgi:CRP/FNR family transcriptional regulator, cyclic AMP receptor protein
MKLMGRLLGRTRDEGGGAGVPSALGPAKVRHLSAIDVFRDLGADDLQWLVETTTMVTAPRARVIYAPAETPEALFLLKRGRVQLYRMSPDGKKLVTAVLEPETFFGEMALAGQHMSDTFAEALEDALLCVLSRRDLEQLIQRQPLVGLRLLEAVSGRLRDAEALLEDVAFKSVPARLAGLLVRLAGERGTDELHGLTHQDLADMVGTYRETATATLDQFKGRRLLELGRKQIRILDRAGLVAIAAGERAL